MNWAQNVFLKNSFLCGKRFYKITLQAKKKDLQDRNCHIKRENFQNS